MVALQWEPQWEEVIVEDSGIRLRVLRDKTTGLIACPVCGLGDKATYLFTVEDLVRHIIRHAIRDWRRERVVVAAETEEHEHREE